MKARLISIFVVALLTVAQAFAAGVQVIIKLEPKMDHKEVKNIAKLMGGGRVLDEIPRQNLFLIEVPEKLAEADVCLGIFGDTEKAQRVIPNKVYEAMAMGKPVITGDTPAARWLLTHREHAFLVPVANSKAIADAVIELMKNRHLRDRLSHNGRQIFLAVATPEILGGELAILCQELVGRSEVDRR